MGTALINGIYFIYSGVKILNLLKPFMEKENDDKIHRLRQKTIIRNICGISYFGFIIGGAMWDYTSSSFGSSPIIPFGQGLAFFPLMVIDYCNVLIVTISALKSKNTTKTTQGSNNAGEKENSSSKSGNTDSSNSGNSDIRKSKSYRESDPKRDSISMEIDTFNETSTGNDENV
jgi:hypothetical protein